MFLSKLSYIFDSGKYYMEVACERCGQKPAAMLEADCHGDAMSLCKEHWTEWLNTELLSAFNENVDDKYVKVENPPKKYAGCGQLYKYKR